MINECTNNDMKYIHIAIDEASKSTLLYRHGCVATSSGKVVARGYNKYRTFSKDGLIHENCSCHAEIDVLRKCKKKNITKKLSLYIVRLSGADHICNSFPCKQCFETMKEFPIKNITYSAGNGIFVKESMKNFESDYQTSGQDIVNKIEELKIKLLMKKI
tara:strand:- start:5842 stop:6321 length:480 start_codon:yes stop_codon:yes gene_type:complete